MSMFILAGEARLERATNRFKVCYSTIKLLPNILATCTGIEPVFFCVTGRRINHFTNRPNASHTAYKFRPTTM